MLGGALRPVPSVLTVKAHAAGDGNAGIVNRIRYRPDTVVEPQLTLAMSDDTLFGYVTRGASRPLPDGLVVTYASNRPAVVTVDAAGVIRTVSAGVATVTATAEYQGVRVTAAFVLQVG